MDQEFFFAKNICFCFVVDIISDQLSGISYLYLKDINNFYLINNFFVVHIIYLIFFI